ncbi:MAG: DUF2500 domain-containing protein [Turicibacter sp.]|nr:DUF2500 domain-containing protein [Turicibacter sp.]
MSLLEGKVKIVALKAGVLDGIFSGRTKTQYDATVELENGFRCFLEVPWKEFFLMAVGDEGILGYEKYGNASIGEYSYIFKSFARSL